jgi:hypothetical protein
MTGEEKIWIRVDGKPVEDHALDADTFSKIVKNFQGLIYELKERYDSLRDYKLYISDIKPGSSVIGLSNPMGNIHKAYGIVNSVALGINNANSCEDIDTQINKMNKTNKASKILKHIDKFWPKKDIWMGITMGEEPPKDKNKYIYFNPSKRKFIEELIKKYHEPINSYEHGILIALDSDLKRFGLKTLHSKIKGKYDSLPTNLKDNIANYFDKPVKIYGEYDIIKKEFIKINSISMSDQVQMKIFGSSKPNKRLKDAIDEVLSLLDSLINSKYTLDDHIGISKIDALKKALDKLEDRVEFKHFSETREDMLWDYTDVLRLFSMKYNKYKTLDALIEMKELFNDFIYGILLPIPDKIEKNQCEGCNLNTYESLLLTYKTKLNSRLTEIESKYDDILPTYEELKENVEKIKLDDDLKVELGKIVRGERQ